MRYSERTLDTEDSTQLFVRQYLPETLEPARTLLIVHGVCEYGGRYEHVARAGVDADWAVVVPDLRGHGRSAGIRTHVSRFSDYVSDIATIVAELQLDPSQLAILGHSAGGLIAVRYAQRHPESLAALVLVAPFLSVGSQPPLLTALFGRLLSVFAPRTRFQSRIEPANLTRDPEAAALWNEDALMERTVTAGWFFEALATIKRAWKRAPHTRAPLLVMQGALDQLIDPVATEQWVETAGSEDKTFELFPEHLHELLNEPDRTETIDSMLKWLGRRIPLPNLPVEHAPVK